MKQLGWLSTKIRDLTIGDAIEAHYDGVNFVCGDGKLRRVVTEQQDLINIIKRKEV